MQPYTPKPGKRHNLFILAFRHFPSGLLATAIGIAFLSAPLLYNLFRDYGFNSVVLRVLLTGVVIGIVPLSFLYIITLLRSGKIRKRIETEAQAQLEIISGDLEALQAKEKKEEKEVIRLEQVVKGDIKARKVKDEKEDERWDLLNESLRLQNETVELASEERLLVAQQIKDIKDEGEVIRKGLVSDDLEARHIKENKDEIRWNALHERLRISEERSEERERRQVLRDEEYMRLRHEDELKDQYRTLFSRYVRNSSGETLNREVADGLAPIPEAWLKEQPEIRKNPALMQLLEPYNER